MSVAKYSKANVFVGGMEWMWMCCCVGVEWKNAVGEAYELDFMVVLNNRS
jgi:hypothetical protein